MTGIEQKKMKKIISNFKNKRILVLGDLMLDKYLWGNVARISPEARRHHLGAAQSGRSDRVSQCAQPEMNWSHKR